MSASKSASASGRHVTFTISMRDVRRVDVAGELRPDGMPAVDRLAREVSVLPRFFLVLGHQRGGQLTPPWPGGGRSDCAGALDGEWVAWRVVGSNHRELGRSAVVFANADAAREGIAAVRSGVELAVAVTEALCGMWGWQLHIEGAPAVVSSRLYQRARDCADSLATAVAGIKVAELRDAVPRLPR